MTGKSERAGHNSVALPTAAGRREGDRICPALTDFPVTQGDIHSTAVPWRKYRPELYKNEQNRDRDLFMYYELNVCRLKRSKLFFTSSSHLGLTVMSLASHPDDPGSIPGWATFFYKSKDI